jgi:hypothetical protein
MITKLPKQHEGIFDSQGFKVNALGDFTEIHQWRKRWYEWEDILRTAEDNPALNDLIKQAEMIYALTR